MLARMIVCCSLLLERDQRHKSLNMFITCNGSFQSILSESDINVTCMGTNMIHMVSGPLAAAPSPFMGPTKGYGQIVEQVHGFQRDWLMRFTCLLSLCVGFFGMEAIVQVNIVVLLEDLSRPNMSRKSNTQCCTSSCHSTTLCTLRDTTTHLCL